MRALLTLSLLLLCFKSFAQRDNRFRIHVGSLYSFNTGAFNSRTSDKLILGMSRGGYGGILSAGKTLYRGWGVCGFASVQRFEVNRGALERQMVARYGSSDVYYTTQEVPETFELWQLGIEVYHSFYAWSFTFEPFARFGLNSLSGYEDIRFRIKKKDDNYMEDWKLSVKGQDVFDFTYAAVGLHASTPVSRFFNVFGGVFYTFGNRNFVVEEEKVNLFKDKSYSQFRIQQPFTSIQTEFGMEFRFGRR